MDNNMNNNNMNGNDMNNMNMGTDMGMQTQDNGMNMNNNTNDNNNNMNGENPNPVNNNQNKTPQMKVMDKKTMIIIAVVAVVVVILIIIVSSLFGGSASAESALPKSSSKYGKICTGNFNVTDLEDVATDYAMGIYEESGKIQYDVVIMWSAASKGKQIIIPDDKTEAEVVSTFATATGMTISLDGETVGSANNYYKNGRVYITRTLVLDSSQFSTVDSYADELKSIGAECK